MRCHRRAVVSERLTDELARLDFMGSRHDHYERAVCSKFGNGHIFCVDVTWNREPLNYTQGRTQRPNRHDCVQSGSVVLCRFQS